MPQYLAPGVYVEEVSSGIKPIVGRQHQHGRLHRAGGRRRRRCRSSPGRVGHRRRRQLDPGYRTAWLRPSTLSSSRAGRASRTPSATSRPATGVLAHAVYGFFNNGGSRCWITRVAARGGGAAAGDTRRPGPAVPPTRAGAPTSTRVAPAYPSTTGPRHVQGDRRDRHRRRAGRRLGWRPERDPRPLRERVPAGSLRGARRPPGRGADAGPPSWAARGPRAMARSTTRGSPSTTRRELGRPCRRRAATSPVSTPASTPNGACTRRRPTR